MLKPRIRSFLLASIFGCSCFADQDLILCWDKFTIQASNCLVSGASKDCAINQLKIAVPQGKFHLTTSQLKRLNARANEKIRISAGSGTTPYYSISFESGEYSNTPKYVQIVISPNGNLNIRPDKDRQ